LAPMRTLTSTPRISWMTSEKRASPNEASIPFTKETTLQSGESLPILERVDCTNWWGMTMMKMVHPSAAFLRSGSA
jgi:hypothetical protein